MRPSVTVGVALALLSCSLNGRGSHEGPFPQDGGDSGGVDAGGSGGFPGSDAAVLLPYAYRRRLHVEASNGQLPTGLTVSFELDHAALVAAGKCAADGHDLRVLRRESGKLVEVTRVLALGASWASATTRIEFSLLADVTTPTDDSYYVYYGDNEAGMADEDRSHVYLVWDDFEDGTLDPHWKLSQIGGAVGLLNQDAGKLHIEALGDDIGGTSDELVLVSREVSGDFVADCRVAASGGALGADAKVGGVMVRQSLDAGSQQRIAAPMNGAAAFTNVSGRTGRRYGSGHGARAESDPGVRARHAAGTELPRVALRGRRELGGNRHGHDLHGTLGSRARRRPARQSRHQIPGLGGRRLVSRSPLGRAGAQCDAGRRGAGALQPLMPRRARSCSRQLERRVPGWVGTR